MDSGRDAFDDHAADARARQKVDILSHLDGALDEHMLDAMQGVWAMLEHAAADAPSHARAVRARLFWESLSPGGVAAAPTEIVRDLQPSWDAGAPLETVAFGPQLEGAPDGEAEAEPERAPEALDDLAA